jgi:3-keto-disaccharide hydrolase
MKIQKLLCLGALVAGTLLITTSLAAAENSWVGRYALTIPGGGAGWLGITENNGHLAGSLLWGGGSVDPVNGVHIEGDKLVVTRIHESKDKEGKKHRIIETITATRNGKSLELVTVKRGEDGKEFDRATFTGNRIPPVPPAPDLSKVRFGKPITLFNGKDLAGWETIGNNPSGWHVENGIMMNSAPQEPGKHKSYANIRTKREFEDFNLTLQVRVPHDGNSGVYLRGIYEVQVLDSYGKPLDSHNMGAIYSRIRPTVAAERPAGQWETLNITLVDHHVTVILNGKKIIDNQPLLGCTGGALWSNEFRPGPIYLQGDHTSVDYRRIVLRPVIR